MLKYIIPSVSGLLLLVLVTITYHTNKTERLEKRVIQLEQKMTPPPVKKWTQADVDRMQMEHNAYMKDLHER